MKINMGARKNGVGEGDTRGEKERRYFPPRLSPSRAPFFLAPILFSCAYYAGYVYVGHRYFHFLSHAFVSSISLTSFV